DPVEPDRVEGRERGAARLRELEDDEPAAGSKDPRQLAQPGVDVGQVADPEADRDRIEAAGIVGELERVGPLEAHRLDTALGRLLAGEVEHRLREVTADDAAAGSDPARELETEVAGP